MANLSHVENQGGWKNCAFQNWYQMLVRLAAHNFQRAKSCLVGTVYYTKADCDIEGQITDPRFLSISMFSWLTHTIKTIPHFSLWMNISLHVRIIFCLDILVV